jgi:succinate-semialdehyde dehydrogenase/glutarate-semialdehyde dehydrogenase
LEEQGRNPTVAYRSVNPYTEELVAEHDEHTDAELEELLAQADRTFREDWRSRSFSSRGEIVARAADLMLERQDELARLATTEMGKLYGEAFWEVGYCADILRYFAEQAESILAPQELEVTEGSARLEARPLGAIFCIKPWNFPYFQLTSVAGPMIMAGNTVVMKHAPSVPGCALAFAQLFADAGAPDGVYTNVFLSNEQAAKVIEDPRIAAVSLTGSERAGAAVAATAGKALKKVSLELGGSDPFIVLEDADLDSVVEMAVAGRMTNTGQACAASKRFIVHTDLYEEFNKRFAEALGGLTAGDPLEESTQVGPLVNADALARIEEQIATAREHGAEVTLGGGTIDRPGYFLEPTILTNVATDNPVFRQELFAPVAMVFEAGSEEEAIELANDTPFGLAGAVHSGDTARAERVAAELDCGMVWVNHLPDGGPQLPWGGVKNSGYGREMSHLGISDAVNWKLFRTA